MIRKVLSTIRIITIFFIISDDPLELCVVKSRSIFLQFSSTRTNFGENLVQNFGLQWLFFRRREPVVHLQLTASYALCVTRNIKMNQNNFLACTRSARIVCAMLHLRGMLSRSSALLTAKNCLFRWEESKCFRQISVFCGS